MFMNFDIGSGLSCIVEMIFLITAQMRSKINTYICFINAFLIHIFKLTNFQRPPCRDGILKYWTQKAASQILGHYDDSIKTWKPCGCHHDMANSHTFLCPQRRMQMYFSPCDDEKTVSNVCHWKLVCCNSDFLACLGGNDTKLSPLASVSI